MNLRLMSLGPGAQSGPVDPPASSGPATVVGAAPRYMVCAGSPFKPHALKSFVGFTPICFVQTIEEAHKQVAILREFSGPMVVGVIVDLEEQLICVVQ